MNNCTFTTKRIQLLPLLTKIAKPLKLSKARIKNTVLELTITDDLITLVIPGAEMNLKCKTKGTAKATIGLLYFTDIIKNNEPNINCVFTDGQLSINGLSIQVKTTFFENDSILRSIKMPLNYTDCHLLQLPQKGFTVEEIRFNNLQAELTSAKRRIKTNITKAHTLLQLYGVNREEIENLVHAKVYPK